MDGRFLVKFMAEPQSNQRGIETEDAGPGLGQGQRPQSNQRGIETPQGELRSRLRLRGLNRTSVGLKPGTVRAAKGIIGSLNRTSVGLKPDLVGRARDVGVPPQSNQRGIETEDLVIFALLGLLPQSNQRGIETVWANIADRLGDEASIEPAWD